MHRGVLLIVRNQYASPDSLLGKMPRSNFGHGPATGALVRASLLALTIASVSHSLLAAEPPPGASQPTPNTTTSPSAGAAAASTLYDVVVDLGRNEAMRREIASTLRETSDWKTLADRLEDPALASDLKALEEGRDTLSRARYMELVDADTRIRERARMVNAATAALGGLTRKVEGDLERLDREAARWPVRAKLAREREAPLEIQRRTEGAGPELAAMRDRLRARRDELLVAYDHGIELQSRLDAVRATVADRRERISAELRTFEEAPIWRAGAVAFPREEVVGILRLAHLELVDFLRQYGSRLGALFVVLTTLTFVALRRAPTAGLQRAATARSARIPLAGALLSSLVFVALLAPRGPFIFYRLIGFAIPPLAGVVATKSFAAPIPATAWTLVFAGFINEFRIFAEMSPGSDRLLLALQLLPFGAALVHDWRRGALARFLSRWPPVLVRRLVQAVLVTIAVIVVASVLGYAGIARPLTALVVVAPGFALIFAALAWALDHAFAGLLATPLARSFRSVRERGDSILRALHGIVVLFCWTIGIVAFALAHAVFDELIRIGNYVANAGVSAGDVTITLSAILSALLVVAVTWLVTKVVRFVLDHEILPRLDLRTGVPIAISTIVGYVLVVTGFVLAMAALGIDLTKVTLLAGALGIGVGLGLQSVVNNFASGLILMLERPINVGDQIDVGGVLGEVKRIGVRSSTIRTFQGAEVIVPNADLASKQVTNWTLSDRARRYEIDVGVAYGSDPAQVLRLLEGAVADLPDVQKVPPPRALFTGFGDSSLDFRLFAWVESVDIGVQAQNSMRVAILHALDEAGIEIPFPQRDLHIRYSPAALGPTSAVKTSG
jgi:small-conductance mechanosensitive channel